MFVKKRKRNAPYIRWAYKRGVGGGGVGDDLILGAKDCNIFFFEACAQTRALSTAPYKHQS